MVLDVEIKVQYLLSGIFIILLGSNDLCLNLMISGSNQSFAWIQHLVLSNFQVPKSLSSVSNRRSSASAGLAGA